MTKRINKRKYDALLATALPAVIKTEGENERMLALAEQLIDKGQSRTPEFEAGKTYCHSKSLQAFGYFLDSA